MIHVVLGTKAQLVKMAPLMARLQEEEIPYRFIFTGQHQETIDSLRQNFNVKDPDVVLYQGKDITSVVQMFFWILRILWMTVFQRKKIFAGDQHGIVLVHGDTFSTLLGALMGRFAGIKVGHIESGLRSFKIFHPFPEELTRILVFWLAQYYFCPGKWAVDNLEKFKGVKINTEYNTLLDSLNHVRASFNDASVEIPPHAFGIVTTHRFENLVTKEIVERNLKLIESIASKIPCVFILHPITEKKFRKYGLLERLETNKNIELRHRYDYLNFMKLVEASEFVVTDGGSNQEECFYAGKPCLLLRKASEREEGIGLNVVISQYDAKIVESFVNNYSSYKQPPLFGSISPCKIIVKHFRSLGYC